VSEHLFTYGTLSPGQPNEHVLSDVRGSWRRATVRGRLFPEGWGAALGYPGIVLAEDGEEVAGFVFTSEQLADHWERLDRFEGKGYERARTRATLPDGNGVEAYVYVLRDYPPQEE
jgi:gamma-glutamylcyclotransferase (GGCT)/AIG2-like uncharacterized protein YtfP